MKVLIKKRGRYRTLKSLVDERLLHISPQKCFFRQQDVDKFNDIVDSHLKRDLPVFIVADYDVDGDMVAQVLYRGIQTRIESLSSGSSVTVIFPKRMTDGYGLNEKIIDRVSKDALLITGDNGIAALSAVKKAKEKGIKVIVTDHHLSVASGELPCADLIIDPNAIPGQCEFTAYCGAGVAYKLVCELNGCEMTELRPYAAVATVADVVELTGENWLIAKDTVNIGNVNPGLKALSEGFKIESDVDEDIVGFQIGPALNAPGRLFDDGAKDTFKLMTENDPLLQQLYAFELIADNDVRKEMTEEAMQECVKRIPTPVPNFIVTVCEDCHEGIVGLVAGKIAEKFQRPTVVLTKTEKTVDGETLYKGSGRTYGEINLKEILDKNRDFLYGYGGHAAAAGLTLVESNITAFREAANKSTPFSGDDNVIFYDIEITEKDDPLKLCDELKRAAPYGQGNPKPVFLLRTLKVLSAKPLGVNRKHIKIITERFDLMCFDMGEKLEEIQKLETINVIGTLSKKTFRGKTTVQVEVIALC